jgi:hypothetical protein
MSNIVPADAAALPGLRMAAAARILKICLAPIRQADNVTDEEILNNLLNAVPPPQRRLLQGRLFRLIDAEGRKSMTRRDLAAWNDAVAELRGAEVVNKVAPTTTATLSANTAVVNCDIINTNCSHHQLMLIKATDLAAHPDDTTLQLQVQILSLLSTDATPYKAGEQLTKRFAIHPKLKQADQTTDAEDAIDSDVVIPLSCTLKDQVAQAVLDECCDPNYAAEDAEADEEKHAADGSSSSDSSSGSDISAEKKKEKEEVPLSPELGRASSEEEEEEEPAGEAPGSSSRRRARTIVVHKQRRSVRAKKQ